MLTTIDELTTLSIEDYEKLLRFKREVEQKLKDKDSIFYHSKIIKEYLKQFTPE